jgi:hypothetical protein
MEKKLSDKKTEELVKSPYYTDSVIRLNIDKLLQKNAGLEATLGKDSTLKERIKVKIKQDRLFLKIKELDKDYYNEIVIEDDRS